ncbi:MAG: hypothetical protein NTV11_15945 [Rhodocyclales bacterium]|nr:hypothetical protein [Rhodocyclales bacterium]
MTEPSTTVPEIYNQITAAVIESLAKRGAVTSPREQLAISEDFFRRHPEQFIRWLTEYYPLTASEIVQYQDRWDWELLSNNTNLDLTDELVSKFEDRWSWRSLIKHPAFRWSECLMRRFDHHLFDHHYLFDKPLQGDDYTEEDRDLSFRLYKIVHPEIPWKESLLERNADRWDWSTISFLSNFPWSVDILDRYRNRWDWQALSQNESLPWSPELLEKYKDLWHWEQLSLNRKLPWSEDLVEKYAERWKWEDLSKNCGLPWSGDLIAKYKDRWNWNLLVSNSELPWSPELVVRFSGYWAWGALPESKSVNDTEGSDVCGRGGLSENGSGIWSANLLDLDPDGWEWEVLSWNRSLPWSADLLAAHENRWHWITLSCNTALPWSESLLRQFEDRWEWGTLRYNESIPWSEYLAETFIHRLEIIPSGMTVSIDFAERHQQFDQYAGIIGVFNRKPEITGWPTCFDLTHSQVKRLMVECFGGT